MRIIATPRTCSHCGDQHLCATAPEQQPPVRSTRLTAFLNHLRLNGRTAGLDTTRVPSHLVYAEYQHWCRATGALQHLGPKTLSQQLAAHGFMRIRSNGSHWDMSGVWGVHADPGDGTESGETIDQ